MSTAPEVIVRMANQGEAVTIAGMIFTIKAKGEKTGGQYGVVEILATPGSGMPTHRHAAQEMFYVLEGEFEFELEQEKLVAGAGTMVSVPPMQFHCVHNRSATNAKVLIVAQPAGLEQFFQDCGYVVVDRATPAKPLDEEDLKRMNALAHQYQIELRADA